jgi:hypothetical protein
MRKLPLSVLVIVIMVLLFTQTSHAQNSGATNVYRTQFVEMRGKVRSIFERVERELRGEPDYKARVSLKEEMLALTKLIHRLDEEALRTDTESMERGRRSNKTLLLVSQGCRAMDFVLNALDNYITTEDRSFLSLARDGDSLITSVEKML